MKPSQLALLCLALGLVIGTALGYSLGGFQDSAPVQEDTPIAAPSTAARTQAPPGDATIFDDVQEPARAPDATKALKEEARRITQRVAASYQPPEVETSGLTGEITGWVLDEDGQPIAGAIVSSPNVPPRKDQALDLRSTGDLGRSYQPPKGAEAALEGVERMVAHQLRRAAENAAQLRTAESDAKGQFRLTGLWDGHHALRANAEGFVFEPQAIEVGNVVELHGTPVRTLELDVRLPDGSQPHEAAVAIFKNNRRTFYAWSPAEPGIRLGSAIVEMKVRAGALQSLGYSDLASEFESEKLSLNLDQSPTGARLVTLRPARQLRVEITDTSTIRPRLRTWLRLLRQSDDPLDWTSRRGIQHLMQSKPNRFFAKDLDAGAYVLGIGRGDTEEPEITRQVSIDSGEVCLEVTLGELDMSKILVVRCVSPSGRPVKDVRFRRRELRFQNGKPAGARNGIVDSQPAQGGTHWIQLNDIQKNGSWNETSRYTLTATSEKFGSAETSIHNPTDQLTITFEPPCSLTVTASGDDRNRYLITVSPRLESDRETGDGPSSLPRFSSDLEKPISPDGTAQFHGLQPGAYEILLGNDDVGMDKLVHRLALVTLRAASEEVKVKIPSFHNVEVSAPGLRLGTPLRLAPEGVSLDDSHLTKFSFVDQEQHCSFKNVPAGTYRLFSGAHPGCEVTVTVPTGEVTFETDAPNALRVVTIDPSGAAALAGLRVGDIITLVDGKSPTGRSAATLAAAKIAATQVTLSVLRGGSTLQVPIGPVGETDQGAPRTGFGLRRHHVPK